MDPLPNMHLVLLASFLAASAAQSAEGNISTVTSCDACPGGVCSQTCRLVVPVRAPVVVTRTDSAARFWWFLFLLVIPVALLALCLYSCVSTASRRKSFQVQPQSGVAMGPVATQPQAAYGYPVAGQPATAVYVSPGPVYGAAPRPMGATPFLAAGGAGLLGGYMLGSALAD